MRILLRLLILVPLGFVAACIAAAATITIAAGPRPDAGQSLLEFAMVHAIVALIFAAFVGFFTLLPALVAIALAEIFRWRSPVIYLGIGCLIGVAIYATGLSGEPFPGHVNVFGAAGAVAGAAYWLIAGRSAGLSDARRPP